MKTAYIGVCQLGTKQMEEQLPLNQRVFVIGVKGKYSDCNVDNFVISYPQVQIVKRLPEVMNLNYPGDGKNHTLQPTFVMRTK